MALILPQFPVGSVLMPYMPLALRVFEPRYLKLMGDLVGSDNPVFGVPLYPQRVSAGQQPERLTIGTVAKVEDFGMTDENLGITATGTKRFVITKWLEPDPYPRAEVEYLPELVWDYTFDSQRMSLELEVRNLLTRASKYGEMLWDADTEISDEPVASIWQLCGMLPVGGPELHTLLESEDVETLIENALAICAGGNRYLDALDTGQSPADES
ncbi:LON peptidase substrate-binding domain-containing protein [Aurantimicrobium sp. MWH-Uga1]|uniref:LON peptidase substrate-binding domain-containing protein n=1 Tax=Aurantimicrobium sp. MWH-Uga1 TaxID=2079575 RepID=UPI000DEDF9B8|nr:LON peptidase substrate-binding domain-containing protein [Aurantimicrobium sp. MWH-Uga1]AXE53730.1 ATP-dependent protease La (LON) domain protein [Aurantimicrobium sp. MWH-Uga1]